MRPFTAFAALALVAAAALLITGPSAWAQQEESGGPPGYGMGYGPGGYGMGGYGMGFGMGRGPGWGMHGDGMGGGMGGGMGFGMHGRMGAVLAALPPDKQKQLRDLHFTFRRQMIAKRAELEQARLDMAQALQAFPLDAKAAGAAFAKVSAARQALFQLRLSMMSQVQQIVGKETWESMHNGWGPGMGYGPNPGPMGPGRGPGMGPGPGMMGPPPAR